MSEQNEHLTFESIRIELFEKDMKAHLFGGLFFIRVTINGRDHADDAK
jgi:hypothetical protein